MGMGGASVASGFLGTAVPYNPASILNLNSSKSVGILFNVSLEVNDSNDIVDGLDTLQQAAGDIATDQKTFIDALTDLENKQLVFAFSKYASVGIQIGVKKNNKETDDKNTNDKDTKGKAEQSERIKPAAFGFYHLSYYRALIAVGVAASDLDPDSYITGDYLPLSAITLMSAKLTETGISYSTKAKSYAKGFAEDLHFGLTAKVQQIDTYNFAVSATNSDYEKPDMDKVIQGDAPGNHLRTAHINFDLGMTYDDGEGVRFGLVLQNMFAHAVSVPSVDNTSAVYMIEPVFTAGAGYNSRFLSIGVEADLNERTYFEGIQAGGENIKSLDNEQFLSFGIEFGYDYLAFLRFGFQHNLVQDALTKNRLTLGARVGSDVFYLDVSAFAGLPPGKREVGAAFSFGTSF